jgi:hypothetical protein
VPLQKPIPPIPPLKPGAQLVKRLAKSAAAKRSARIRWLVICGEEAKGHRAGGLGTSAKYGWLVLWLPSPKEMASFWWTSASMRSAG